MSAIVAVDRNWAIGKGGKLLTSIPDDLRFFRQTTRDKVVIMGRKTLESLPGGLPLPNRTTVVVTRDPDYKMNGIVLTHSVEEAIEEAKKLNTDIYICGGGEIYKQMLDLCDEALVTYIDYPYQADTYFPNLDKRPEWVMVAESEEQTHFDIIYYFRQYHRRKDFEA
ncbi:MAG: dihydrofolate reductase [Parasporobacterium sp.]|nr:dihydrofolate reductase [Parasporobacterium sp.]